MVFAIHTYGNESQIEYKHRITDKITSDYQIYNKISGVLKILDDKEWQSYMWNKIYRKKLFDNIQFPKGRGLDEDLSVMHLIFHNASSSIYINSEFYYYLHREGSICSSIDKASQVKKLIDRNAARWEVTCLLYLMRNTMRCFVKCKILLFQLVCNL